MYMKEEEEEEKEEAERYIHIHTEGVVRRRGKEERGAREEREREK
jgi:hypothetical protein